MVADQSPETNHTWAQKEIYSMRAQISNKIQHNGKPLLEMTKHNNDY